MSEANRAQRPGLRPGLSGNYYWDLVCDEWQWAPELYTIYGVSAGVTPTTELLLSLTHGDDRQRIAKIVELAENTTDPFSCELRIERADDKEVRRVVVVGEVSTDENGATQGLRGFVIDVTDGQGRQTGESLEAENDRLRRELTALRAQTFRSGEPEDRPRNGWLWIAPLPEPVAVVLAGEIDLASRIPFTRALQDAIVRGNGDVYLDLSNVDFIDTGGVEVLLDAVRGLAKGRRLVVLEPVRGLRRILTLMRVERPANLVLMRGWPETPE